MQLVSGFKSIGMCEVRTYLFTVELEYAYSAETPII